GENRFTFIDAEDLQIGREHLYGPDWRERLRVQDRALRGHTDACISRNAQRSVRERLDFLIRIDVNAILMREYASASEIETVELAAGAPYVQRCVDHFKVWGLLRILRTRLRRLPKDTARADVDALEVLAVGKKERRAVKRLRTLAAPELVTGAEIVYDNTEGGVALHHAFGLNDDRAVGDGDCPPVVGRNAPFRRAAGYIG